MVREGYKQTEVGVIPVDWELVDLGSLFQFKNGINATKEQYGTGYKFINVLDIIENEYITHDKIIGRVNVDASSYAKNEVNHGDIVFQRSSETAEEVGQAAVYLDETNSATFGGFVILGKKIGDFDSRYLNYQLQSPACRREIVNQSGGSTRYNISQVALRKAKTILPPTLTEQRAIATALSDTDALLSALDALIGKKEAFKRGMMEGLLSGERRLEGFSGEWEETTIGEIASIDEKNLGTDTKPDYEFKYLSLENVNKGTVEGFTKMSYSQSPSRARRIIEAGCIVFATVRPLLMSHALIKSLEEDLIASTGFAVIRAGESTDSKYLFYIMTSTMIIDQVELLLVGSNYPAINSKDVKNLELSLPPLPEQRAIAKVLSDLDAELAGLRARRAKLGLVKGGMMGVLLSGEVRLV